MSPRRARVVRPGALALLAVVLAAVVHDLPAQATLRVVATDVELPAADAADYSARASRAAAIDFVVEGCTGQGGCTLSIWAPAGTLDLEWQLDATAPGGWRPLAALPSGGEVMRGVHGTRRGLIFVRARLDWERGAPLPLLGVLRLSLATN